MYLNRMDERRFPISADNGIYLLQNPIDSGFEWRVIHAQAIDNIFWEEKERGEGNPGYVVDYFGKSPAFTNKSQALAFASKMYDDIINDVYGGVLEYGISFIQLPHPFSWYVERSKT